MSNYCQPANAVLDHDATYSTGSGTSTTPTNCTRYYIALSPSDGRVGGSRGCGVGAATRVQDAKYLPCSMQVKWIAIFGEEAVSNITAGMPLMDGIIHLDYRYCMYWI